MWKILKYTEENWYISWSHQKIPVKTHFKSSLLFSTYNWPEALELVLLSLLNQSKFPDEVVIADDGSTEETRVVINRFKTLSPIPIVHVWQKDLGYRKTSALNKALAKATGDYIIQIDGDCIMHKNFIQDHLSAAEKNTYLFGSRVNIKENIIKRVLADKSIEFSFFARGINRRTRNLRIPVLGRLYGKRNSISPKLRGCNTSFWRTDLIKVNGFNEDMKGWGHEDSELAIRFHNNGIKAKRLRYRGIVYHIWHKVDTTKSAAWNEIIEQETLNNRILSCKNGIDKYMPENG